MQNNLAVVWNVAAAKSPCKLPNRFEFISDLMETCSKGLIGTFRTQSNISDRAFYENSWRPKAVHNFRKKPHLRCLLVYECSSGFYGQLVLATLIRNVSVTLFFHHGTGFFLKKTKNITLTTYNGVYISNEYRMQ